MTWFLDVSRSESGDVKADFSRVGIATVNDYRKIGRIIEARSQLIPIEAIFGGHDVSESGSHFALVVSCELVVVADDLVQSFGISLHNLSGGVVVNRDFSTESTQ